MKRFTTFVRAGLLAVSLLATGAAIADPIGYTSYLVATDPIQLGRLSRNGVPSDGTPNYPFPGIINPSTPYHYHSYTINVGADPFVVITFDSLSASTFISAYQTAYYVNDRASTYLGDPGTSGNYFGTDPLFFNFVATPFSQVVLIVNETSGPAGLGLGPSNPFTIYAQSFSDSDYSDYPGIDLLVQDVGLVIPEPSTILLLAIPFAAMGLSRRRRKAA